MKEKIFFKRSYRNYIVNKESFDSISLTFSDPKILTIKQRHFQEEEIAFISKKIFVLSVSLILKYSGYKGHLVDYSGYQQLHSNKKITEHLFKIH